jgi:hypothetical protein
VLEAEGVSGAGTELTHATTPATQRGRGRGRETGSTTTSPSPVTTAPPSPSECNACASCHKCVYERMCVCTTLWYRVLLEITERA